MVELATAQATRLTEARVNGNVGNPLTWFRDNQALLVRMLPAQRPALLDTARAVPTGPTSVAGAERALVTCDDHNAASAATIERCGGVLEDVVPGPEGDTAPKRRYWLPTA